MAERTKAPVSKIADSHTRPIPSDTLSAILDC